MKHWPLRYQLWMLLLAVLISLAGMFTHTTLSEAQSSVARVREQNLRLAQLMGANIESFVEEQERHIQAIAARPGVQQMDATDCDPVIDEFVGLHPIYYGLSVLDLNGNFICASSPTPLPSGASMANAPIFQEFLRSGGSYIMGDVSVMPATGDKIVGQLYPIRSETGKLLGAIGAPILLHDFGDMIENSRLPDGTIARLMHEDGTILARSVDNERWTGVNVSDTGSMFAQTEQTEGWLQGRGVDGVEKIYGFSRIPDTSWYIYVSTPMRIVYAPMQRLLLYNLGWGLFLIGLVLIVALIITRNVEQPIFALSNTVRAITGGDSTQRAPISGPKEIAEVASSFNAMLQTLETTNRVLYESEMRFRRVLENSQDAMYQLDLRSLRYDYISPVIEVMLGYSVDETRSFSDRQRAAYLHPDDREHVLSTFSACLQSGSPAHYLEYRCIHKNGDVVWLGDKFSVQHGADGIPRHIVGALRDITSQKIADEELRAYEERLRVIVEASPDLIVLVDEDGGNLEILNQNPELLPLSLENVNGKPLSQIFSEGETAFFMGLIKDTLSSNQSLNVEFPLRIDNRDLWLEGRTAILNLRQDGKRKLLSIIRDVTERREAEEELRKFTRAIEQSPASVVITDTEGKIEYVNPKFSEVTGYDPAEVIGGNPRLLKSGYQSSEFYAELWQQIATGHEWRGELCNRRKNGDIFWEQASISPIKNENGIITHYLAIKEDITDRRRIEDQLRQQDRLAAVGQLAAGIAHDFNNIMSAIMLYARMLQQHAHLTEKEKARLDVINDQAQHAVNLIRQILDFSRRSLVERGPIDLVPFFKEMVKMWERTLPENIQMEFMYDANHAVVKADPTRLQQAMLNLVLNARDAMPDGGILKLSLSEEVLSFEQMPPIQGMQPGHWLCITCEDSGNGIEADILPHIFDPFFTTKDPGKGTGLGLAQVYGIVGQHDGFIDVHSAVGLGAAFRIYLPLEPDMEPSDMPVTTHPPRAGNEMILLVEDNNVSRGAIEDILNLQGYRILCARNGTEALTLYRQRAEEIDLVLSDMIMPEMSGQELYQAVKAYDPTVKMVLMTGYPLEEEGRKLLEQGLFAWLQKPFTIDALSDVLSTALDQPAKQPQPVEI